MNLELNEPRQMLIICFRIIYEEHTWFIDKTNTMLFLIIKDHLKHIVLSINWVLKEKKNQLYISKKIIRTALIIIIFKKKKKKKEYVLKLSLRYYKNNLITLALRTAICKLQRDKFLFTSMDFSISKYRLNT